MTSPLSPPRSPARTPTPTEPNTVYDKSELRKRLSPLQYHVTQDKGTERAFTGTYYKLKDSGIYSCIVCGTDLFSSDTKYDSGSGWPAFSDILSESRIHLKQDTSHVGSNLLLLVNNPGLIRTEVSCSECGAHMGHVFKDGPRPTGKRYCINSASLCFRPMDSPKGVVTDGDGGGGAEEGGRCCCSGPGLPPNCSANGL